MLDFSEFDALEERDEPWHIDPKDKDPRSEFDRQLAVLRDGHIQCPGVDFCAIPNAGKSSDWERIRRWREGARAGALDLIATWSPTHPDDRGVAFIEMKDGEKGPSPEQITRLNLLYRMGHNCGVFRQEASVLAFLRRSSAPFLAAQ